MTRDSPIRIYDWIQSDFTCEARAGLLDAIGSVLEGLCGPGSRVLDLCCGGGAVSFFLEARGAKVTGIDLSPKMIESAGYEARKRRSTAAFLVADILKHDFGASLHAAFTVSEVQDQLQTAGLALDVEAVSDRHLVVSGVL